MHRMHGSTDELTGGFPAENLYVFIERCCTAASPASGASPRHRVLGPVSRLPDVKPPCSTCRARVARLFFADPEVAAKPRDGKARRGSSAQEAWPHGAEHACRGRRSPGSWQPVSRPGAFPAVCGSEAGTPAGSGSSCASPRAGPESRYPGSSRTRNSESRGA